MNDLSSSPIQACAELIIRTIRATRVREGSVGRGLHIIFSTVGLHYSDKQFCESVNMLLADGTLLLLADVRRIWRISIVKVTQSPNSVRKLTKIPRGATPSAIEWCLTPKGERANSNTARRCTVYQRPTLYIIEDGLPRTVAPFARKVPTPGDRVIASLERVRALQH